MRLKKIKLAGFKSFVDATVIPFPGDMTAVVGPNGCGKSNVIDAVRWVLGESSAKNLRGDSMTDVIFNGSSARKPVSQCSVELVFDNSSGRISGEYAQYNELSIKRVVTQEATSNYSLNGTKCRRRDVTDIFLGTGLGPRSYAIIEQGMISKLIESKPQELRIFIEEAAGISKYKERRRETENRIKHTKENLERLDDVRLELGQQLAKLQRQAATAKRYTDLKQQERNLKSELTALRWLKQNQQIENSEIKIREFSLDLEAAVTDQMNEHSDILQLKENQADIKQEIDDIQHTLFNISNEITKIEQNQIFTVKRKQQIQVEIELLNSQNNDKSAQLSSASQEIESVQVTLDEIEPSLFELEEIIEQAEHKLTEAEEASIDIEERHAHSEDRWRKITFDVQNCHSKIESTMTLQMRTETRINELKDLIRKEDVSDIEDALEQKSMLFSEVEKELASQKMLAMEASENLKLSNNARLNFESEREAIKNKLISKKAHANALELFLQQEKKQVLASLPDGLEAEPLAHYLQVIDGYADVVQSLLDKLPNAIVIKNRDVESLTDLLLENKTDAMFFFETSFTNFKKPGSFAEVLYNEKLPLFFNHIFLCDEVEQALNILFSDPFPNLIVTKSGVGLSKDCLALCGEQSIGSVSSLLELESATEHIEELELALRKVELELSDAISSVEQKQVFEEEVKGSVNQLNRQAYEIQSDVKVLQEQLKVKAALKNSQVQELEKQTEILELEIEKLDSLNMQAELLSDNLIAAESELENNKTTLQNAVAQRDSYRAEYQRNIQTKHDIELKLQKIRNTLTLLLDKKNQLIGQLEETSEKRLLLDEELMELSTPGEEQDKRLAKLIEEKQAIEKSKILKQNALDEMEQTLTTIENGQISKQQVIEKIRKNIESETILVESAKVRAQGLVEQLKSTQMRLQELLENLPQNIEEEKWQAELEDKQRTISKLGAVNLAAVEEYEQQAKRKEHLDAQNDDLMQALETLENAIRKIDKETRTRFKHTFDKVNNDLKLLFPKVFGGGNAYLDLTEDDLLETGVTIMARPPGKKNSTIHLLSGGEKALTALSLVFAIFRLNPAPFCLLDEVDAPLDDANVGRFCKLVSEMSKTVQFIYITHNKVAMEMASHLTGVTMAEPGVSRMVSVDIEEALAIAE